MSWKDKDWVTTASVMLKIAFGISVIYVVGVFLERSWRKPLVRQETRGEKLHDDLYVHPPKAHVTSLESARRTLIGKPLWVQEGFRWAYQPGDALFEPLEKIVPAGVYESGGQARIAFQKDGREYSFAVSGGGRYFVDEIFFIKDPRELYAHWSEEEWEKIGRHEVEAGMSEFQITFALGFGIIVQQSSNGKIKVVEYTGGVDNGLEGVRVEYRNGVAQAIETVEAVAVE